MDRPEQVVPAGAERIDRPVERLVALLGERVGRFAEAQFGTREGIDLRFGRRGLVADEAAAFLRAVDAGLVELDGQGGVTVPGCRAKPGGGRYSLFAANRYGGDLYVSLNLEYLIHLGAACELVADHGWPGPDVEIEVGEFDAIGHADDRVALAMEAKARIDGPDSLTSLWASFVDYAASDTPPEPRDNHSRKYVELLRLAESGPMLLWLVAAQARWPIGAERVGNHIEFHPIDGVDRATRPSPPVSRAALPVAPALFAPDFAHAVDIARLTEFDGQQRAYEYPWSSEQDLETFVADLAEQLRQAPVEHAKPWKWKAASSGGKPLTPSGRTTGLELRFAYSPRRVAG